MKYIFTILAFIPALSVGISSVILFFLSEEYIWLMIPSVFNLIGFTYLLDNTENIERNMKELFKLLAQKEEV